MTMQDERETRTMPRSAEEFELMTRQLSRLKQLCEFKPRDPGAFRDFAEALARYDRHEEAAAAYRRSLALKPGDPALLDRLAVCVFKTGDHATAIDLFKNLVRAAPRFALAHHHFGVCLRAAGLPDEALRMLEAAARLNPRSEATRFELGQLHEEAGRLEMALVAYAAAFELNPRGVRTLERMALVHERLGDLVEACGAARAAYDLARNHPRREELKATYQRILRRRNEYAREETQRAAQHEGSSYLDFLTAEPAGGLAPDGAEPPPADEPDDYLARAREFETRGEWTGAIAQYKRAVALLKYRLDWEQALRESAGER